LVYSIKRKFTRALLGSLLPLLIYMLINFTVEAILYTSETWEIINELSSEEVTLRNIIIGIGDMRIVLSAIGIILWCSIC